MRAEKKRMEVRQTQLHSSSSRVPQVRPHVFYSVGVVVEAFELRLGEVDDLYLGFLPD